MEDNVNWPPRSNGPFGMWELYMGHWGIKYSPKTAKNWWYTVSFLNRSRYPLRVRASGGAIFTLFFIDLLYRLRIGINGLMTSITITWPGSFFFFLQKETFFDNGRIFIVEKPKSAYQHLWTAPKGSVFYPCSSTSPRSLVNQQMLCLFLASFP